MKSALVLEKDATSSVRTARLLSCLGVKTRLVIHAFPEQFGTFLMPFLDCLNRRFVAERSLRNAVVVNLDVIAQRRLQLGS